MRVLIRTTIVALAVALIAPAAAAAAVTLGQSPPTAGTPATMECKLPPPQPRADLVQITNTTGNPYAVPAGGGVITSWRTSTSTGSAQMRLRLFTQAGSTVTPQAESDLESLTPTSTSFATRIPVTGGELLGLSIMPGATGVDCYNYNTAPADVVGVAYAGPIGSSETLLGSQAQLLANVSAQLEPDADGDGYGDETQDACPTEATNQGPCNAFTIGKKKANKKNGTAKVTVTVPGAGVVALSGKGIATKRVEKSEAGDAKLTVKPKDKTKKKLKSKGKAKLTATITFTPTGGEAAVQTTKVKLKLAG